MQAQQAVSAEPQAPGRTVQTPAELVPTLPVPRLVKSAGVLKDALGKPRTGMVGVTFAIYKEQEGGAALWLETQNVELDEQGHYTVLLGATKGEGLPLELFTAGEHRWLGVQVNLPGEVEQPRLLLVSVPYALKAVDADTVGGMPASSFVLATPTGVVSANPKTGAKTTTSGKTAAAPAIGGGGTPNVVTKFDGTGANVINSSISDNGSRITAAEGIDFGSDFSFVGNAEPAATGRVQMFDRAFVGFVIRGLNVLFETLQGSPAVPTEVMRVTNAGNVGIGTTTPADRLDVFGPATDVFGQAIFAQGGSSTGTAGTAQDGIDPHGGDASGANGFAGFGVFAGAGNATAATGGTGGDGGDFLGGSSSGTSGFGGFGVFGRGGNATAAGGVAGDGGQFNAGTGTNGAANGLAGFFQGDIHVTGAITAGTKDFKIDHPLDPGNKYLVHASVESSEMLNIYTGNATLNASGSASVLLPGWFETVNKDFRYQLTAVGAPGPNLHVAQEIQGGRFVIAGGQPGMKVSWQVTGVRQDAFAKAHSLVVEEEKLAIERGHYIHPELYGAPEEASVQWARHPQLMRKMKEQRAKRAQAEPVRPTPAPFGSHPVAAESVPRTTKQ